MGSHQLAAETELGYALPGCVGWSDPLPYQVAALDSEARILVLQWGRGCGKTVTLWLTCLLDMLMWRGIRVLCIGPSYKTLTDGLFPVIQDTDTTFRELYGYSLIKSWAKSAAINRMTLINGSTCTFRSTSNIDDLRGGSYGMVLIEEGGYIDANQYSWGAFIPVLRGLGPHRILCGGTPAGGFGVLGTLLELAKTDPDIHISRAATTDNPHFPESQLRLLEATLSKEMWSQEVLGEAIARSGLVYPEWNRQTHIRKFNPMVELHKPGWELYEVIDWGFAMAHRLTLAVKQAGPTRAPEIVVVRDIPYERSDAQTIIREVISQLNEYPIRPRAIITDPEGFAENRTARRMITPHGISVVFEKHHARRRIESTTEYVRRGLCSATGDASFFVSEEVAALDCNREGGRGIIPSFESYRLQEVQQGSGVYKSKPKDDNKSTHSMDCARMFYICMRKFGYVWPLEFKPVLTDRAANQWG